MDFKDQIKQFSERIQALKEQIATEEATKNAFIMPFIQMLGYDVFNPMEVVPEMDCDIAKKKGEKIDYAIMKDGEPIMLIECKHWEQNLDLHSTQLQRYYVASKAKFGVLTNGITYRFYTDLSKTNIMDDVPFLEVNMECLKDAQIDELKKFHKSYFDIDNILSTASELKYMSELKSCIKAEFNAPSADLVRMFAKRVYDGMLTQKVLEQFTSLVKRSLMSHVNDVISERLSVAINSPEERQEIVEHDQPDNTEQVESRIVTTEEEMEGFYIVKSILRDTIDPTRVTYRDAQTRFSINIDDNNRKCVCKFYFDNPANLRISFLDDMKKEKLHSLSTLDDIYSYSDMIIAAAHKYI